MSMKIKCADCLSELAKRSKSTKIVKLGKTTILTNYEDEPDWTKVAMEFKCYPATMGSFYRTLCEAITLADNKNTDRLRVAYPELVKHLKDASPCGEV